MFDFLVGMAVKTGSIHPRDPALVSLFGGGQSSSAGEIVTETTALGLSAYYACIRNISEDIAKLPLIVYKPNGRGRERATDHPVYRVLHDSPNDDMTSMTFRETILGHCLGWGNGYAEIQRDGAGRPVALWPLDPASVFPQKSESGELVYRVSDSDVLFPHEVFHVHGLGYDGIKGYSVATIAKETIGESLATQKSSGAFYGNDSTPSGVIQYPGILKQPDFDRLRKTWEDRHKGAANARKVAVLEKGMTYAQMSVSPQDAQFIESRQFQLEEVCRWFRMPPHKVHHLLRSTFSNIEHQGIEYVVDCLLSWMVRFEQEAKRKLFSKNTERDLYAEHLIDGLMRGDTNSRYRSYAVGRQWGWLSANDILKKENMDPIDGGDVYLSPANMVPADQVGKLPAGSGGVGGGTNEGENGDNQDAANAQITASTPPATPKVAIHLKSQITAVLADSIEKILRKEANAAIRAATNPSCFVAWIDEFYGDKHEHFVRTNISPVMSLIANWQWRETGSLAGQFEANAFAKRHVNQSREDLLQVSGEVTGDGLPARISVLAEHWLLDRPVLESDAFVEEYIRASNN